MELLNPVLSIRVELRRSYLPLCGAILIYVTACTNASAAPSAELSPPRDGSSATRDEFSKESAPAMSNTSGVVQASQPLDELIDKDREQALRELVTDPDLATSTSAARLLILQRVENIGELIATRIPDWPESTRRMLVQSILTSGRGARLLEIPRRILKELIANGPPGSPSNPVSTSIDLSALLLAERPSPNDGMLIRRAVRESPYSRGLWLALAETGTVEDDELILAITVYRDPNAPLAIRTAAAIAAAARSKDASEFVETQLNSFNERYANKDMGSLAAQLRSGDEAKKRDYFEFQEQRRIIAMLRYLKTDGSQQMVFDALSATNEAIRQTAALVASKRWPGHLVDHGQGRLGEQEYARLMAVTLRHHPALEGPIRERVPEERLEEALATLDEFGGVAIFEWGGPPVAGF